MNLHKPGKLLSCILVVGLLLSFPLTLSADGKQKQEFKKQSVPNINQEQRQENKAMLRTEQQTRINTIKEQAVQVKQLTQSVAQLNRQLQKQLTQIQKNKVKLTPAEIQQLKDHLQKVRTSTENLSSQEQKYKQAYQQWQKSRQTSQTTDSLQALDSVRTAQEQKINQLKALQQELQSLIMFLNQRS